MKRDFNILSPDERRIIIVATDEKYKELCNSIDYKKLLWLLLLPFGGWGGTVLNPLFASSFLHSTISAAASTKKEFRNFFRRGEIPFPHLSPSEAIDRFSFDHGHLQNGMAYIVKATNPDYYLVPALVNERLAQDKVTAFLELSSALGAKQLELLSAELLDQEISSRADFPLKQAGAQIGIEATFGSQDQIKSRIYSEYGKPAAPPYIPENVVRWLEEDSMFRSLANDRLKGTLLKRKVTLRIESSIDVGAKALASIKSFKVGVGGEYHRVARSSWSFEIEFWPKD